MPLHVLCVLFYLFKGGGGEVNSCCRVDLEASGIGLVFTKSEFVPLFISSLSLAIDYKVCRGQSPPNSVFQCLSTKKFYP